MDKLQKSFDENRRIIESGTWETRQFEHGVECGIFAAVMQICNCTHDEAEKLLTRKLPS